jgi:tetratricopeptide (TPR) repeat protein
MRLTCLVGLLVAFPVRADDQSAKPLDVPRGPLPQPEQGVARPLTERVDAAAEVLRLHGYLDLQVLALALVREWQASGDVALAERALELAPDSPALSFEVGLGLWRPLEVLRAAVVLPRIFPGTVWLLTWIGALVGIAAMLGAACICVLGFARTVGLHGHAFGHFSVARDPPAWPGVLLAIALLAALPAAGFGPALVLAAAGMLAAMRLPLRDSIALVSVLAVVGGLLGPPLDHWGRMAALPGLERPLLGAWRLEHAQSLPGDLGLVEKARLRNPEDPLLRLALATAWKRAGDLDRAGSLVEDFPASGSRPLVARAANIEGTLALARGDLRGAVRGFERARSAEESARVLFNLSQAHGRALDLADQRNLFAAARALDPQLVSSYTGDTGTNLHAYLMEIPIPWSSYMRAGFEPSVEAAQLARAVRRVLLGAWYPEWAWLALPGLGLLGLVLRRPGLSRCVRCMRPICQRCASEQVAGATCVRCARLFSPDADLDARVRKREIERDRRRQRQLAGAIGLAGALVPGAGRALEGHLATGFLGVGLSAFGIAAYLAALGVPVPPEVGALGTALPLALAVMVLVPLYGWAWVLASRRLKGGR